ncbi:ABC transporter ATP-binding protein [bacterium]|nr:MAG: ABC transporter ATP-binding protein [bacterium]
MAPSPPPIVALRGVAKRYDEAGRPHTVLDDVSLELPEGEVVAILGRSGSGKSTLLNLIAGIDAPTAGVVEVAGVPVNRLSERERTLFRRHTIGFVFQFFNLIPTLTVLENVCLPLELTGRGPGAPAAALPLLDAVGLADRRDSYPDRLSGGEQQRVAIARALAADPRLVLADEPTGNLDAETGDRVLDLLVRLTRARGRSLIMATHSHAVAAAADRVLRVDGHHVVAMPAAVPGAAATA